MTYKSGTYTMRSGTKGKTVKNGKSWLRGEEISGYGGYYYQPLSGFTYGWLSATVYKNQQLALKACSANPNCSGVTKLEKGKFKLNSGKTVKKGASYTLYQKEGLTSTKFNVFYGGFVWVAHSPYQLTGKADGKTYKSRSAAFDACMQNKKCKGFTQHSTSKYLLNTRYSELIEYY